MRLPDDLIAHRRFVLDFDVDDIGQLDIRALACIMRAAEDGVADKLVCRDAEIGEARANGGIKLAFGMIEGEFYF
nr:hypothetical protein [Paraburkholderia sp. Ac-20347]